MQLYEPTDNVEVMVVMNKKTQLIEYEKKSKLIKINIYSKIGNGKIGTNRLKSIVLSKILPHNQFNCQSDVNIVDEIREIRNVNLDLSGSGK